MQPHGREAPQLVLPGQAPKSNRYKTVSLKTADIDAARSRAFDEDADVRFRIKHEVPIFNRPFSQISADYAAHQKERFEAGQIAHKRWREERELLVIPNYSEIKPLVNIA